GLLGSLVQVDREPEVLLGGARVVLGEREPELAVGPGEDRGVALAHERDRALEELPGPAGVALEPLDACELGQGSDEILLVAGLLEDGPRALELLAGLGKLALTAEHVAAGEVRAAHLAPQIELPV